jgi:hypothetical protein
MKQNEGARSDVRSAFNAHISPMLGKLRITDLTTDQLRNWRDALSKQPKRFRTGKSSVQNRIVVIDRQTKRACGAGGIRQTAF